MDTAKFEGLVEKALEKFEGQGAEIATMKATFDKEIARLAGQVETLAALNPAKAAFVQHSRGVEVPWETKEHAVEFARFMRAAARHDDNVIKQMNENNAGDGGGGAEADGGYLVPVEFKPTLLRIIEQYGVARQEFQIVPMTRDEMQFPVYNGEWTDGGQPAGPTYWVNENAAITPSWAQFANVTMTCRKLAALVPTSNELLQDAALPIASLIATLVGEFLAKEEDRVGFVAAVGDSSNYLGAVPSAGKTVTTSGTAISSMTAEDLLNMTLQLSRGALAGAKFYMHRSVMALIRTLKTVDGMYIYQHPSVSGPATIWGYPIVEVETLRANSGGADADQRFVLFGNLKNMYMGDRMSLSVASTDLVGFANFQTHFRFVERIGFKAVLPDTLCALKTHA
jgi:HK97 family phage major capsid protein